MIHEHVWGPEQGPGRMTALAVARGWEPAVCVVCGARPEHEHVWHVTRIDGETMYLGRCRDCDLPWSAAQEPR